MIRPFAATSLCFVLLLATPFAQDPVQQIKTEAFERSRVMEYFDHLVLGIGPRLTGSPQYKAAAEWARDTFASLGLENARLEPFEFGRGWVLDALTVEMIEPYFMPLIGYAEGWSAPTNGEIVGTPVLVGGKPEAEVMAMKDRLAGAIVL